MSTKRSPYGKAGSIFLEMQAQETDDCIIWPYATTGFGYGDLWYEGRHRMTHRISCELAHGDPPSVTHRAAHSCHTPACFNPRHLRWATAAENSADMVKDGTAQIGENNAGAKLTEDDVRAIRHYASCGTRQKVLAEHYGVTAGAIASVVSRTNWKHVK